LPIPCRLRRAAFRGYSRTLAHHGVLFLDELAEFDRSTLDALRQPLEEGTVTIARVHGHVRYPARFQLVAAMNPCRCGYATDPDKPCRCARGHPEKYVRRVSGPFLDRIDMQIEMARVPPSELLRAVPPEPSAVVKERIAAARALALQRNDGRPNARLSGTGILRVAMLTKAANNALAELATTNHLTARSVHRLMRVSRTIADLEGLAQVTPEQIYAAASLRDPAAQIHDQLAA
jgi:magnesium chelatase family protein